MTSFFLRNARLEYTYIHTPKAKQHVDDKYRVSATTRENTGNVIKITG